MAESRRLSFEQLREAAVEAGVISEAELIRAGLSGRLWLLADGLRYGGGVGHDMGDQVGDLAAMSRKRAGLAGFRPVAVLAAASRFGSRQYSQRGPSASAWEE